MQKEKIYIKKTEKDKKKTNYFYVKLVVDWVCVRKRQKDKIYIKKALVING